MSHETESPAQPPAMAGTDTVRSPDTEVPASPPTEVVPAPAVRYDLLPRAEAVAVGALAAEAGNPATVPLVPPPRPSETIAGSQGPLHTAEDANTVVDISSLSPDDAERIIAAADAEKRPRIPRPQTLRPTSSALPPPPPLRAVSSPAGSISAKPRPAAQEAADAPRRTPLAPTLPSAQSTRPPVPPAPRRGNTLLLYGGSPSDIAAKVGPGSAEERDSVEELGSDLLVDEGDEVAAQAGAPGQTVTSTSLMEDPSSRPDVPPVEEGPPLAPFARSPSAPPGPLAALPVSPELAPTAGDSLQVEPEGSGIPGAAAEPPVVLPPLEVVPLAVPFDGATTQPPAPMPPAEMSITRRPGLAATLIIGGAVVLAVSVGVLAFAIQWLHTRVAGGRRAPVALASATAVARPPTSPDNPAASAVATAPGTREPATRGGAPCVLAGAPHVVAPRALLRTGIETVNTADRIAIGVALGDKDGLVLALDPSTFASDGSARAHATDPLRRVVPILEPLTELTAFLETSRRHVPLEAAHPVPAHPSFVVGVSDRTFVWAPGRSTPPTGLWSLVGDGPVDAVRAIVLPGNAGYAIAFRQGTSLYLGALRADRTVNGDLVRIAGIGPQIGAPAMAAGSQHVLVAWADRSAPAMPWAIRWLRWQPGTEPEVPNPFPVPAGGSGGQVMAPALASLADGRFVIVWTEGAGVRHEVRAQALDSSEQPIGTAITVSADGVNAGQGMPALTPDGRGAVVFMATPTGATASVVAVPVLCPGGA